MFNKTDIANFTDDLKKLKAQAEEVVEKGDNLLSTAAKSKKMWDEFEYKHLLEIPPKKKPCFLAGTLVHTINGAKPIEQIELGEVVLTYNKDKSITEPKTVTELYRNSTEKYLEIYTSDTEVIKATGQHRFYNADTEKWVTAVELKAGTNLLNTQLKKITIVKTQAIKNEADTYNLEVVDNHNYFVGQQGVLSHNANKKLKFSSEVLYEFRFYEFLDSTKKPIYVGQTTQKDIFIRGHQHSLEFKKFPAKKEFMKFQRGIFDPSINGLSGPYRMTALEAAVTEMYELNTKGGKRIGNKGLFNKKNPVSERSFNKYKQNPNFNPCRFYV